MVFSQYSFHKFSELHLDLQKGITKWNSVTKNHSFPHPVGKSQTEKESLSQDVVRNLRDQLKINRDYFSMLVVGKDGDVKAWFPSPMWSMANIYDLVDSMELRQQEDKLQQTLGIHCPEDRRDDGEDRYHGYAEET